MKRIVRKIFWDYAKEEAWLNAMAAKGLALSDYSWCRYAFEETEPGAYQYRILLMEHLPTHPEGEAYLRFLEGAGVEIVATYLRWVYLRQPASSSGFELFTDTRSKLAHGKTVLALHIALTFAEAGAGLANLTLAVLSLGNPNAPMNLTVGLLCSAIALLFLFGLLLPQLRRVRHLVGEMRIRE